jgi:hypothetical protein
MKGWGMQVKRFLPGCASRCHQNGIRVTASGPTKRACRRTRANAKCSPVRSGQIAISLWSSVTRGIFKALGHSCPRSLLSVEWFARDDHLPHMLGEVKDRIDKDLEDGCMAIASRGETTRSISAGVSRSSVSRTSVSESARRRFNISQVTGAVNSTERSHGKGTTHPCVRDAASIR